MPTDEIRVARARRKLDQLAQEHPEAFSPDRLPTTPSELAAALGGPRIGRPPLDDPKGTITLRVTRTMLEALDAAAARCGITRQDALREAIRRWLRAERRRR